MVRYADDFIITGTSEELLENKIKSAVEQFLHERGLVLSQEKTKITHITAGFNFLGFNIRKYPNNKLFIKPSKENSIKFLQDIRSEIKRHIGSSAERLRNVLNPKIRGWAYYYRHVVSKDVFSKMDHDIFLAIYSWIRKRHPHKSRTWRKRKYFRSKALRNWIFSARAVQENSQIKHIDLFNMGYLEIKRHRKIVAMATPFDPSYKEYFDQRKIRKKRCSLHHWADYATLKFARNKKMKSS